MYRLSLFGPFSLTDSSGRELSIASKKTRALLAYLAQTPGKPRSREEILALLWSDREEAQGRASLRQVLTGLRKDVGEDLLLIDRDSVAINAEQLELSPPSGQEFLAGFSLADPAFEDWLRDERLRFDEPPQENTRPDRQISEKPVIAILPFENLSNDPDQAFFSDGITQDIMTELSHVEDLVVLSPRATFQYRDRTISNKEIGTQLGAHYIVEGSVRQAGHRVRIVVQLTDAATDSQLWADRFDRDLTDVFEIQDEVARRIAGTVAYKIEFKRFYSAKRRSKKDLSAYEMTLRGEWNNWQKWGSRKARQCFEEAIAIDANCARAYAQLAHWHGYNVYVPFVVFEDAQSRVRDFAQKTMALEPNNTVCLTNVSCAYQWIGDHHSARHYLDKAIETNPRQYDLMIYAAQIFAWQGETDLSLEWLERYLKTSALNYTADSEAFFEIYYLAERYDEAIAAMAAFPGSQREVAAELAAAYAQAGRLQDAEIMRQRFEESKPEGHTFEAHAQAILRTCARERERDLWRDGYRKAGFA